MKEWAESVKEKDSVLDVGCGEGRLLQGIGPKANYTGIDFSEELIKLAKKRHKGKNRKFITGNISKSSTWKNLGMYNKIFVVAVVHHLPSKKEQLFVLQNVRKHLKVGGTVYVSFWNLWERKFWGEHFKSLKLKLSSLPESVRWVEIPFANTKLKRFYFAGGKKYWERVLAKAGWENAKIKFDTKKKNMWAELG
jgi:2-polyprenyl-3-methyl-5-hydroxy-6-metoxy-1,4-benzoquinol methylase